MNRSNVNFVICVVFISTLIPGFSSGFPMLRSLGEDKSGSWRIQRANLGYTHPIIPRPPPYISNNPYFSDYPAKPTGTGTLTPFKPKGTGAGSGTRECLPGIPKCVPRVGR